MPIWQAMGIIKHTHTSEWTVDAPSIQYRKSSTHHVLKGGRVVKVQLLQHLSFLLEMLPTFVGAVLGAWLKIHMKNESIGKYCDDFFEVSMECFFNPLHFTDYIL